MRRAPTDARGVVTCWQVRRRLLRRSQRMGKTPAADGQDSAVASHTSGQDFGQDRARTVTSMTPKPRVRLRDAQTIGPVRAFSATNLAVVVSHLLDKAIDNATSTIADDKECREQD